MYLVDINGIKTRAANHAQENTTLYTKEEFLLMYPQFTKVVDTLNPDTGEIEKIKVSLIPDEVLDMFIDMANKSILASRWFEKRKFASGLYVAHYVTMFMQSYATESDSINDANQKGQPNGLVSSTTLGDASVSYDNSIITNAIQDWGIWASTRYGQLLVNEAKLIGKGGAFIV